MCSNFITIACILVFEFVCICTGFTSDAAARVFDKLMQRLGFKEYYAQGGDWGSLITLNMAIMFPK